MTRAPFRTRLGQVAALAAALTLAPRAEAQRVTDAHRLAMHSRPAVVRILDGYSGKFFWPRDQKVYPVQMIGSGSGFFLNPNGYIATNAHVTQFTQRGEEFGKQALFQQFLLALARAKNLDPQKMLQDTQMVEYIRKQAQLVEFRHTHHVVTGDGSTFPFEIKSFGEPNPGIGKDVSILKIEVRNAPTLRLGDDDRMNVLDPVVVIGYPAAADTHEGGNLSDGAALVASVTDGSLSARKPGANGAPILQISAPATHGNSGGPVLNDRGEVVGLLTFRGDTVNGQEVGGFSFVVTARTVMEFVRQAGAANEEGLTDQQYRSALRAYWAGDYRSAISRLEDVQRLYPHHAETRALIASSQEALLRSRVEEPVPVLTPAPEKVAVRPAAPSSPGRALRAPARGSSGRRGRVVRR